jgi:tRNA threonylcarbamoyladenosine biosynthesis protein TsaB
MLILSMDTTGSVCTVALLDDKKLISEVYLDHLKTHSEGLMPMVEAVLNCASADIADIGAFACVVGPGSFTGIRIGVSAAKAFAQAGNKPCVAVNTLDSLSVQGLHFSGIVCPMLDARRQEVYNALYNAEGEISRLTDYRALPLRGVLAEAEGKRTLFLGDGAAAYRREIEDFMGQNACFAAPNMLLQRASSAGLVAYGEIQKGNTVSAYMLEPFYIRKPQAVRCYEERIQ